MVYFDEVSNSTHCTFYLAQTQFYNNNITFYFIFQETVDENELQVSAEEDHEHVQV